MKRVELLAPAKNKMIGKAAIANGADAIYVGAPAFGARQAAGNSLEDIQELIEYAHQYYCKVFVTLNTIIYDDELEQVEQLIHQLYAIGTDAIIIQDLGILRLNLPPIALHASTQMHNYDLEKIKFLDQLGFSRIVLARELSLEQIREIRTHVKAELEVFIHGALCVSLSGQCYLSQHMFNRSANRGECAQPCRQKWNVEDADGNKLVVDEYILSLKDLNQTEYIQELINIGVDSLKIEGRLKDENYVVNVTKHYSSLLETLSHCKRSGSGRIKNSLIPDIDKSFNRGYTHYFATGRSSGLVNRHSPKSIGKEIGKVVKCLGYRVQLDTVEEIHNGDGLCYFEETELKGIKVNVAQGAFIECNEKLTIAPGTTIYRNYDHQFTLEIQKLKAKREIAVDFTLYTVENRLLVYAVDEDENCATYVSASKYELAENPKQRERLEQQMTKCGETIYCCRDARYIGDEVLFIPIAQLNEIRRNTLMALTANRAENRPIEPIFEENRTVIYPQTIDWRFNIVNRCAKQFYMDHGVETIEMGFEKNNMVKDPILMHTRYCILHELGMCLKQAEGKRIKLPLWLCNNKHRFRLEFDCKNCFMKLLKE